MGLALRDALKGSHERLDRYMTPEVRAVCRRDSEWSLFVADTESILGREEAPIEWIDNAIERGWRNYPYITQHDPFLARLGGHSRFQALLLRLPHP